MASPGFRRRLSIFAVLLLAAATLAMMSFLSMTTGPLRLRTDEDASQQLLVAVVSTRPGLETSSLAETNMTGMTNMTNTSRRTERRLNVSVLHPRTAEMAPLAAGLRLKLERPNAVSSSITETTQTFAQHGNGTQRGVHYKLKNRAALSELRNVQDDALLLMVVLNDHKSWGRNRSVDDFFSLVGNFTYPKGKTSLTMLVSSMEEFRAIQRRMTQRINQYAQFSLIFRNDFKAAGLTRDNRHDDNVQSARRRMLARYRNYALLATLQDWQQHVVWLDADVHIIPPGLMSKMVASDRDIVEPICFWGKPPSTHEYDRNAWAGERATPQDDDARDGFVANNVDVRYMSDYRNKPEEFIPLDSVGGTMLYVRAEIHRQGVLFAHHYAVGTTWDRDGFDGIETEGLCYSAHFLGFKCWGMPHDAIYHAP